MFYHKNKWKMLREKIFAVHFKKTFWKKTEGFDAPHFLRKGESAKRTVAKNRESAAGESPKLRVSEMESRQNGESAKQIVGDFVYR